VAAVVRAIRVLKDHLLAPASDARWVQERFHEERASYWAQRCISRKKAPDLRPVPTRTYVDLRDLDRWSMGSLAAYVSAGSKHRRFALQVTADDGAGPHETATRHGWADGIIILWSGVRVPRSLPIKEGLAVDAASPSAFWNRAKTRSLKPRQISSGWRSGHGRRGSSST
jgi:hypothetical protein